MQSVPLALLCCFASLSSGVAKSFLLQHSKTIHVGVATPPSPTRKLTPADWESAAGKFVEIDSRRDGVQETLFAKAVTPGEPSKKCGDPCVAHCIAGQPRDMIRVKGLWKSIKHRLFDHFSENPVVFAFLAMGAEKMNGAANEGAEGYVRQEQSEISNEDVLPSLQFLGVDRALLLREACTTGTCLQEGLRLKCDAKKLGLENVFDEKTGLYTNMCEIQVSRFRDSLELVRDYEEQHNMRFDWVTRPRPDVYFTRPAPSAKMLEPSFVHVSPWAACGYGGMDWFYALPRKYAEPFAEFATSVSCSDYNSDPEIPKNCATCAGCECWMAAWMFKKKVPFKKLPWQWFAPSKFCGADCPADWEVNPQNIMGLDSRTEEMPCTDDDYGFRCPMLLQVPAGTHNSSLHDTR